MLTYDENEISARLETLDQHAKTAFAAACAERLLPLFRRYARGAGISHQADRLAELLDQAWSLASGETDKVGAIEDEATSMGPSDDDDWTFDMGYAQNAAAAVAYAVGTWVQNDAQQATWAAQQVFDAAEYSVSQDEVQPGVIIMFPAHNERLDQAVVQSAIVQSALNGIEEDLLLVSAFPSSWDELRSRAAAAGRRWASEYR